MTDRDIGRLEARMDGVETRLNRMEAKLDDVHGFMAQARGSWKTLAGLATISAALGAVITKLVAFLASFPMPR